MNPSPGKHPERLQDLEELLRLTRNGEAQRRRESYRPNQEGAQANTESLGDVAARMLRQAAPDGGGK